MKMVQGAAYLMNKDYTCESGRTLYKGYAVILKKYNILAERAHIEFDGYSFDVDPSYLDFIEGDAPVEDLKKSRHYIDMLIEELEGRE